MDESTALLLIDVQQGFDDPRWGERNNPEAERNLARLLAAWRQAGAPVIYVQHLSERHDSPLRPGQPGAELKAEVQPQPTEPLFQKRVNSAFIGTALETHLRQRGVRRLVIGGLTTDHCVSTTVRMAANLGFVVMVVADGTATFERYGHDGRHYSAEEVHRLALASLHGEFATVLDTDAALAAVGAPAT